MRNAFSIFARTVSPAAMILATCSPARLNALLGEQQVTELCRNSSPSDANGV